MSLSANAKSPARMRYLLLGSLALNLALVGAAGAVAFERSSARPVPLQPVIGIKHTIAQRMGLIIASLPPNDAKVMRAAMRADATQLAAAEAQVRLSQEAVRSRLRAEPFDPAAVREALAETSAAHDRFLQLVHSVIASATVQMSAAGRETLADWPVRRRNAVVTQ